MADPTIHPRLYDKSVPRMLRSGRHRLSPEEVAASQQVRLYEAVYKVVAKRGYGGTSIVFVSEEAGVSRQTFYQFFDSLEECFIKSYQAHTQMMLENIAASGVDSTDWYDGLTKGVAMLLATFSKYPVMAKVYAIGVQSATEKVLAQRYASDDQFIAIYQGLHARMLDEGEEGVAELTDDAIRACIGATAEMIRQKIRLDGTKRLSELVPAICGVVVMMIGGPAAPEQYTPKRVAELRRYWAKHA